MAVPLLDLKAQYATIREDAMAAITKVIEDQWFIMGPEVSGLEEELLRAGIRVEIVVAGDAYAPRTALEAVFEGELAGVLAGGEEAPVLTDSGLPPYAVSL